MYGVNATVEPFNTYDNIDCSLDPKGCVANIEQNKINPLIDISKDYSYKVNTITQNNKDIQTKITNYNTMRTDMSNNPLYLFNNSDLKKETLLDGMNDDVNELMLQENNMYIVGTIATISLLIASIMISS